MRKNNRRKGQAIAEYFIIIVVILAAVLSVRFLDKIQNSFKVYFAVMQARLIVGL